MSYRCKQKDLVIADLKMSGEGLKTMRCRRIQHHLLAGAYGFGGVYAVSISSSGAADCCRRGVVGALTGVLTDPAVDLEGPTLNWGASDGMVGNQGSSPNDRAAQVFPRQCRPIRPAENDQRTR